MIGLKAHLVLSVSFELCGDVMSISRPGFS